MLLLLLWFDDIFICCVIYGSEICCFAKFKELFGLVVVAVKKLFSEISEYCVAVITMAKYLSASDRVIWRDFHRI